MTGCGGSFFFDDFLSLYAGAWSGVMIWRVSLACGR